MGNACWGASSDDADETFARVGVIFRFFDRDGDGLWNYTETCRWGEVMRGSNMTKREYEHLCRKVNSSTNGLNEDNVAKAYGKGSTLDTHYKRLLSFGDIRDVPNHLFLVPGMRVQIHQLVKDDFLNNTKASVLSISANQNAALLQTHRGPLLVPFNNIIHPIRPVRKRKRVLVLATGKDAISVREQLYESMTQSGGFDGAEWCIPRDNNDVSSDLTKSEIFKWIRWAVEDSKDNDIFIALLSDPRRGWTCADSSFVGPLTSEEMFQNLIHSMHPLCNITIIETGVKNDSLVKDLPNQLVKTNKYEWKSLRINHQDPTDGCTPEVYWITSFEHPAASGRYTRSSMDFNSWPMWEGTDGKRLYIDTTGYWKIAMSTDHLNKNLGIIKSENKYLLNNNNGDRLPGFVGCWYYSLHSRWAKCQQTAVSVSPPSLTVISGSGMPVCELVSYFCSALSVPDQYPEGEGYRTGRFLSCLSGRSNKIRITSMHAPDLCSADSCYTIPDACNSSEKRERYLSTKGLPLKQLPEEVDVEEKPDFYEEQLNEIRSPFRERTVSTDGGLGAFLDGLPRDASPPQSPIFNENDTTVTIPDTEIHPVLLDDVVVAAPHSGVISGSPKRQIITVSEEVKPPSFVPTPTATPAMSSLPSRVSSVCFNRLVEVEYSQPQPPVFSRRLKGLIEENDTLDKEIKQSIEERLSAANTLVEENQTLEAMIERFM